MTHDNKNEILKQIYAEANKLNVSMIVEPVPMEGD